VVSVAKSNWPETIEVKDPKELLAYRTVEEAMSGENDGEVIAQYKLVKTRCFRNVPTEA
jgi:hypothetical protein